MRVHHLTDLTWEAAREVFKASPVVILPVGAIEAHGPHLPLGTDVIIAEAMARAGAERVAATSGEVVLAPALCYTAAPFADAFPGTVSLMPETVVAQLVDLAGEFARQGASCLALANAHLDPAHLGALTAAVAAIRERAPLRVVYPDLTWKQWAVRLTDEFKSGACHAGQYETSIVMAARPASVLEDVRQGLPDNPRSLSAAIADGLDTFEAAGGPRAYFGYPGAASAAEGESTIDILGQILAEAILDDAT